MTRPTLANLRPPSHGGRRAGSGRKPILVGAKTYAFKLTPAHLATLDQWQAKHKLESRSAALRHIIESTHT